MAKKLDQWGNKRHPIKMIQPGYWIRVDGTAEAVKYTKAETEGNFSGWIVRSLHDNLSHSDPVGSKIEALAMLRIWGQEETPDVVR